jgi:hypothetical protein
MSRNRRGAQSKTPRKREKEIASTFRYVDLRSGNSSDPMPLHKLNQPNRETLLTNDQDLRPHPHCAGGVRFIIKRLDPGATTGNREIIVFDESAPRVGEKANIAALQPCRRCARECIADNRQA